MSVEDDLSDMLANLRGDGALRFKRPPYGIFGEEEDARNALLSLGLEFSQLIHRGEGNDPPGCEAQIDGQTWAIEITELIHQPSMLRRIKGAQNQHHEWSDYEFRSEIERLVASKDNKVLKGGPYDNYLLVIRTEEVYLGKDRVEEFLVGFAVCCDTLTSVCLALGYHPSINGDGAYPAVPVSVISPNNKK